MAKKKKKEKKKKVQEKKKKVQEKKKKVQEKKKKVQEKKKKTVEKEPEAEQIPEYSLDTALSSAKTTETTLQTLLKGVSEQEGIVESKKKDGVKITPQLTHESRSKIAEAYVMEDIPLTEQTRGDKRPRTLLIPEKKEKVKSVETNKENEIITPKEKVQVEPPESSKTKPATSSTKEQPSFIKEENIYLKLKEFFEGLLASYSENYDRWEMSISNILAILRKMRKITKKNTEDLTLSITGVFDRIESSLEQFKVKRNEIEKVAEVNIESMSGEFKRVLGMLELQIKEYQLKRVTDEFVHELKYYQ